MIEEQKEMKTLNYSVQHLDQRNSNMDQRNNNMDQRNSNMDQRNNNIDQRNNNLIVNYVPQTMTQKELTTLFSSVGEVESCKLIRDKTTAQSLGYGFVKFTNPEDAEKAIRTLNGLQLQNKSLKVSYARPSSETIKQANLYICGLPKHMTQTDLENLFRPYGTIITSRIICDNLASENVRSFVTGVPVISHLSKGVGFVRFDQHAEAERAIQALNGTVPLGASGPITVKFANSPSSRVKQGLPDVSMAKNFWSPYWSSARFPLASFSTDPSIPSYQNSWRIFIYNLVPEVEDIVLWKLFGPFGAVQSVKVVRDAETGKCKGYGFVSMANADEAVAAIQALNGSALGDRILQVSFKTQKNVSNGNKLSPVNGW